MEVVLTFYFYFYINVNILLFDVFLLLLFFQFQGPAELQKGTCLRKTLMISQEMKKNICSHMFITILFQLLRKCLSQFNSMISHLYLPARTSKLDRWLCIFCNFYTNMPLCHYTHPGLRSNIIHILYVISISFHCNRPIVVHVNFIA